MIARPIIVIGASAGGVSALRDFAARLSPPLAVPILAVLHIGAQPSELPALLNEVGPTPAKHGEEGELIRPGHIYVAPPDRHMIVDGDRIRLTRGPKENWARPAIDPLFRSAALSYGPSAIGVILTGNLNDGSAGLYEIKQRGGTAIVQDPKTADYSGMPQNAVNQVNIDYSLSLAELPNLLNELITAKEDVVSLEPQTESSVGEGGKGKGGEVQRPIAITCPDCGGALRRDETGNPVEYRCHIGHTYTAEAMAAAQFDDMEKVMRSAERILNERAEVCRQMAERAAAAGEAAMSEIWQSASGEALARAHKLRDFIEQDWITPQLVAPRLG
jgi:two-component system, chemotaxis family, protein-glutamate methylesterase/glutaminase